MRETSTMPRKAWTEEERKAFGAKMKAARAAKESSPEQPQTNIPKIEQEPQVSNTTQNVDIGELLKRIKELEDRQLFTQPVQQNVQFGANGLVGTRDRYVIDPLNYLDPRDRLYDEKLLTRFAFKENYELTWNVSNTVYTTIDNIRTREPKFTIELLKVQINEDTGERMNGRYLISTAIFHEDPDAAVTIAREKGLQIDESNQRAFLDEMRYMRIRDWLLDCFLDPKPVQAKQNRREVTLGNKVVPFFEINSVDKEAMPFAQLNGKL
jgi:hypothetical protein